MTDDVKNTLRNLSSGPSWVLEKIGNQAADRIDKLEEWLRLIAEHPVNDSKQWEIGCKEMKGVARAALEEKKDG